MSHKKNVFRTYTQYIIFERFPEIPSLFMYLCTGPQLNLRVQRAVSSTDKHIKIYQIIKLSP